MDKGNHPGLFHLVIKLFPQLLYLPRCLRTRLVEGMVAKTGKSTCLVLIAKHRASGMLVVRS